MAELNQMYCVVRGTDYKLFRDGAHLRDGTLHRKLITWTDRFELEGELQKAFVLSKRPCVMEVLQGGLSKKL